MTSTDITAGRGEKAPRVVTTTLYHLIAVLQDCLQTDGDEQVVAALQRLMAAGRITIPADLRQHLL